MHVKKKTTDIAAVKNALDMSDAKEYRLARWGIAVSLFPLVFIGGLILIENFI